MIAPPVEDGLTALPLPLGDPVAVWRAAALLRAAAGEASAGVIARSGGALPWLDRTWAGVAAEEARYETCLLASRVGSLADRLTAAAASLATFGDALDQGQRSVATLQASWDAAALLDGMACGAGLAAVSGGYAVSVADLAFAGEIAAHHLRELAAQANAGPEVESRSTGYRRRPGAATAVGADAVRDDATVRAATLAGLDIVAGRLAQVEADRVVDEVTAHLKAAAAGDAGAADRAVEAIGSRVRDPVFAQALWARLPPADVALALAASAHLRPGVVASGPWATEAGAELVTVLGTALAVAANPAYQGVLDPVTASRLDQWRGPWLAGLGALVAAATRTPDGGRVGGGWVQGQLLGAAAHAGLSPGTAYAATVGSALVEAERSAPRGATAELGSGTMRAFAAGGRQLTTGDLSEDPLTALAQALRGDAESARTWLLRPLAGEETRTVLDHLVGERHLLLDRRDAAASMDALGKLVVEAGSDPTSHGSMHVAGAFVAAVATTTMTTPDRDAFRSALAPALGHLASVLGAHPDAFTAALDGSAGLGTDATTVTRAEALVRPGRVSGEYDIAIADHVVLAAAVGELAFDPPADGDDSRGPHAAPALVHLVGEIGARLEDDLVAAVQADHHGDEHALDAAGRRLGSAVGFSLASAGDALAAHAADADAVNAVVAAVASLGVEKLAVPGPVGAVATPLVRMAGDHAISALLPTDAEAGQRAATGTALTQVRQDELVAARSLVSRAHPWDASQSPERWAAQSATTPMPTPFWDATGTPLPEDRMTTAQRRSFADWRRDERLSVYDAVPAQIRDAIDAGARAASESIPGR